MDVRDPVHGSIPLGPGELPVLDHPVFQRLRNVRQLGFSELSFPGATHTRYLHSLGTMHLAARSFDAAFARCRFADPRRRGELRQMVRLAALLHDLGHAPLSHATEFAMPAVQALGLERWRPVDRLRPRRATHEDYTLKILLDSSFTALIEDHFPFPAAAVAGLIDLDLEVDAAWYRDGDRDFRTVLSQLVSSELDADRMDYLVRDSYFTGVQYGHFDRDWLMGNLGLHEVDGVVHLALDARAIYTLDHFLLARYHMFLMVYFHHRSVAYERLLRDFLVAGGDGYRIPADVETYVTYDDEHLLGVLRASEQPAARRIVERRAYRLLSEEHVTGEEPLLQDEERALRDAGVPYQRVDSHGVVSKYMREGISVASPPIYVLWHRTHGGPVQRTEPLPEATDLFDRYSRARRIARIYVPAERLDDAHGALA